MADLTEFESESIEILKELEAKRGRVNQNLAKGPERIAKLDEDIAAVKGALRAYRRYQRRKANENNA